LANFISSEIDFLADRIRFYVVRCQDPLKRMLKLSGNLSCYYVRRFSASDTHAIVVYNFDEYLGTVVS